MLCCLFQLWSCVLLPLLEDAIVLVEGCLRLLHVGWFHKAWNLFGSERSNHGMSKVFRLYLFFGASESLTLSAWELRICWLFKSHHVVVLTRFGITWEYKQLVINLVLHRIPLHSRLQLLQGVIVGHRWTLDPAISVDYVPPSLLILPFELGMHLIIVIHLCISQFIKASRTFVFYFALLYQLLDEVGLVLVDEIAIILNLHHLLRIPIVERTLNDRKLRRRFESAEFEVILKRMLLVFINAFVTCVLKFSLELLEFLYQYFFRHGVYWSSFLISYVLVPKYEGKHISCTYPTPLFLIDNLPPLSSSWYVTFVTQDSIEHQNVVFISILKKCTVAMIVFFINWTMIIIVFFNVLFTSVASNWSSGTLLIHLMPFWAATMYFLLSLDAVGEKSWLNISNCPAELCFLHMSHLLLELPHFNSFLELMPNSFTLLNFLPILLLNCIKFDIYKVWHSRPTMNSSGQPLF